eukprot:jgi/Pico_ML_1/56015/g1615.t1
MAFHLRVGGLTYDIRFFPGVSISTYVSTGVSTSTYVSTGVSTSTYVSTGVSISTYVSTGVSISTYVSTGPGRDGMHVHVDEDVRETRWDVEGDGAQGRRFRHPLYWSSSGTQPEHAMSEDHGEATGARRSEEDVEGKRSLEWIEMRLNASVAVVEAVQMQAFRAEFQRYAPLYAPKWARISACPQRAAKCAGTAERLALDRSKPPSRRQQ